MMLLNDTELMILAPQFYLDMDGPIFTIEDKLAWKGPSQRSPGPGGKLTTHFIYRQQIKEKESRQRDSGTRERETEGDREK